MKETPQDAKVEIAQPKIVQARFVPCPDITAYELALLLQFFLGKPMTEQDWNGIGPMQRHFVRQ